MKQKTCRKGRCSSETYLTAAGCVTGARHLYVGVNAQDKTLSPLELRSGLFGKTAVSNGKPNFAGLKRFQRMRMCWQFPWTALWLRFAGLISSKKPNSPGNMPVGPLGTRKLAVAPFVYMTGKRPTFKRGAAQKLPWQEFSSAG